MLPTAEFLPDAEESVIRVNWKNSYPKPDGKDLNLAEYGEGAVLKWDVRAGIPSVDPKWPGMMAEIKDGSDECKLEWDEFRYAPVVNVYIRARLETPSGVYKAWSWCIVEAKHAAWLRPPTGLRFEVLDGDTCIVELPAADGDRPGDFFVELVSFDTAEIPLHGVAGAEQQSKGVVVFQRHFSGLNAGPQDIIIPIDSFKTEAVGAFVSGFLRARARQLESSSRHESPLATSVHWLTLLPPPARVKPRMDGHTVVVDYDEPQEVFPERPDFTVLLRRRPDDIAVGSAVEIANPGTRHSVRVPISESQVNHTDYVSITVRATATAKAVRLGATMTYKVLYPPTITIVAADYDMSDDTLAIRVTSDQAFPSGDFAKLHFEVSMLSASTPVIGAPGTSTSPPQPRVLGSWSPRSVWERTAVIRVSVKHLILPAAICVRYEDGGSKTSDPFPLGFAQIQGSKVQLGSARLEPTEEAHKWLVTWKDASAGSGGATMLVRLEDSNDHRLLGGPQTVPVSNGKAMILCSTLVQGSSVAVFRMVREGVVTGPKIREILEVPSMEVKVTEVDIAAAAVPAASST